MLIPELAGSTDVKTGFWGDQGQGWYYDLLYLTCSLVILTTGGGAITIT